MQVGTTFVADSAAQRWAPVCGLLLGMTVALPAWALDLSQAYRAAYENDASVRAARAAADAAAPTCWSMRR